MQLDFHEFHVHLEFGQSEVFVVQVLLVHLKRNQLVQPFLESCEQPCDTRMQNVHTRQVHHSLQNQWLLLQVRRKPSDQLATYRHALPELLHLLYKAQ